MRRSWIEVFLVSLVCLGMVAGCRSEKPSVPAAVPVTREPAQGSGSQQGAVPATPVPATPGTAPKVAGNPPHRFERPPVDQDATAGVRGTQMVNFVVTENGKPVEGAGVSIVNAKGKSEGRGKTDDWGEFHTGLAGGNYKVSVEWNGMTVVKDVTVDVGTNRVELKVEGSMGNG